MAPATFVVLQPFLSTVKLQENKFGSSPPHFKEIGAISISDNLSTNVAFPIQVLLKDLQSTPAAKSSHPELQRYCV